MKKVISMLMSMTLMISLSGCGNEVVNTNDSVDDTTFIVEEDSIRGAFAKITKNDYEIAVPTTDLSYEIASDLSNVINTQWFYLSDEAKQMIVQNGFVVRGSYYSEFYTVYEKNRYGQLPNFVTTDSLLHTYHLFFSYLMKNVERDYLYRELINVSNVMLEASKNQYDSLKGTEWENAAARNIAYFTVGSILLGEDVAIDSVVQEIVNAELALVASQSGITESVLMAWNNMTENPLKEDYTQYKVRGYYGESEELSKYFQAMMWFGRMTFRVSSEEESKSAVLMSIAASESGAIDGYNTIYDITSYFMGNSDDPGILEYETIAQNTTKALTTNALLDTDGWEAIYPDLHHLKAPSINSIPIFEDEDEEQAEIGFRFMGQRETFDAKVMQQLVYDNIGASSNGENRTLPSTLDIAAVFGSSIAKEELQSNGTYDYEGYVQNLEKIENEVNSTEDVIWNTTVYNGWLNMIRPLIESREGNTNYPTFMQSKAWGYKQLNTFASGFAELKHDTILYSKQVYAEMGADGLNPEDDRGYVEAEPAVFARLATLASITKEGLASYGMLSENDANNLDKLILLSEQFLTIANKELKGESRTEEEYDLIRSYGGQLEHFWYETLSDAEKNEAYYRPDNHPAAIISDIATDPNGSVLEIGTGKVDEILVVVEVEGSLRIASGTVYSYYEFEQPMDQRLTDQEWWVRLGIDYAQNPDGSINFDTNREGVAQPEWVNNFKIN